MSTKSVIGNLCLYRISRSVITSRAITRIRGFGAVEEDRHLVETNILIDFIDFRHGGLLEEACTNHEDSRIGERSDDLCIYDDIHRGAIEEYIIILGRSLTNKILHRLRLEEFGGVGRSMTDRENIECRLLFILNYKISPVGDSAGEERRDTIVVASVASIYGLGNPQQ